MLKLLGIEVHGGLEESGLVNEEQFEAIAFRNAAKPLKINMPAL